MPIAVANSLFIFPIDICLYHNFSDNISATVPFPLPAFPDIVMIIDNTKIQVKYSNNYNGILIIIPADSKSYSHFLQTQAD